MILPYSLRLAIRSILHEKWINLLSVLTIAACLLFTAITLISVYNLDTLTNKLPEKFSVMLYLNDNVSHQDIENIVSTARKNNAVEKVTYISKDEALKELKNTLKNTEYILEGLGENPLPHSIEVKLKRDAVTHDTVESLTASLRNLKGLNEIEYGEKFLSSIYSLNVGMKTIGIIFVIIMSAGMIFVCYTTVKILFYRRDKEIETYKLLGATKGFIRAPFIIEGAAIGLSSGILSLAGIVSIYYLVILNLSLTFPLFKAIIFPINISLLLPVTGLFLGITGALIAIGRIKY